MSMAVAVVVIEEDLIEPNTPKKSRRNFKIL
jgi:hypothetical protein